MEQSIFFKLDHLSILDVRGDDADSFLQGQFSNDLTLLESGAVQLNSYCTPKGRILALFQTVRHASGFWLIAPKEVILQITARLKMYVMRAKVTIEVAEDLTVAGISNHELSQLETEIIQASYTHQETQLHRSLLIGSNEKMQDYQHNTCSNASIGSALLWRQFDILDGIPQVYLETVEEFIPQMINLDRIDGINFKKGCYPGQEIIARLRYLGKLKQRMLPMTCESSTSIQAGDGIFNPDRGNQKVGMVVDAVLTQDISLASQTNSKNYSLLAMIRVDYLEQGELLVGSLDGNQLIRCELPYRLKD